MAPPKKYNTNADRLEAKAEQSREYYHKRKYDPEYLARFSKYYKENKEKINQYTSRWKKVHVEKAILSRAKSRAKIRQLAFDLTLEDIIIPEKCPYLQQTLDPFGPADFCPSIDRLDSTKGYIKGNVEIISFKANRMKNTATQDELLVFAQSILKRHKDL